MDSPIKPTPYPFGELLGQEQDQVEKRVWSVLGRQAGWYSCERGTGGLAEASQILRSQRLPPMSQG